MMKPRGEAGRLSASVKPRASLFCFVFAGNPAEKRDRLCGHADFPAVSARVIP
ncbi:MAG: hypothetical protein GX290_11685 [Treponema sp.]|nr:hypothetical protein [Treponema sp.]